MAVRKINESRDDKFYVGWAKVNSDELYDWLGDSHKIYLHDDGKYYAGTSKDSPNSYQVEDRAVLSLKRDPRFKDKFVESLSEARDFDWNQKLWCVVKDDGRFAGSPCLTPGEARELSYQHDGSRVYKMSLESSKNESLSESFLTDYSTSLSGTDTKQSRLDAWHGIAPDSLIRSGFSDFENYLKRNRIQIHHIDGDRSNESLSNLALCTSGWHQGKGLSNLFHSRLSDPEYSERLDEINNMTLPESRINFLKKNSVSRREYDQTVRDETAELKRPLLIHLEKDIMRDLERSGDIVSIARASKDTQNYKTINDLLSNLDRFINK